jgi:N-acyl-D-aspartate/D-glutamate deacylase
MTWEWETFPEFMDVIRGGTIVDGTGKAAFTGDVAIAGSRIAAVGGKLGPARREIDAAGLLVTPGWVDVHTHYDGQAMWDPLLAPSCWHGVTTVMFGNCGIGFAPVKKHHRGALMDLMEGVEEIPNPVLAAGLPSQSRAAHLIGRIGREIRNEIAACRDGCDLRLHSCFSNSGTRGGVGRRDYVRP